MQINGFLMRNVIVLTNDMGFCAVIRFRESDCF